MLVFDDSSEVNCNSEDRGFSTTFIKQILLNQIKLSWDVQLQNTQVVVFEASRDVMQHPTLSTQSDQRQFVGIKTQRLLPMAFLMNVLSPQADDRLRYCTNSECTLSKFSLRARLKQLKCFDEEQTNFLYCKSVLFLLP